MERQRVRIRAADIPMYLGYALSIVTISLGAAILSGVFFDARVPVEFRYMFGAVLILMGIYRFVLTREKVRRWKSESDEEAEEEK